MKCVNETMSIQELIEFGEGISEKFNVERINLDNTEIIEISMKEKTNVKPKRDPEKPKLTKPNQETHQSDKPRKGKKRKRKEKEKEKE
jgi:hypothetical protein